MKAYKRTPEFWKVKSKPQHYEGKFQDRAVVDIAIGQEKRADGSVYMIMEPVFEDLVNMLFSPNVRVYVDVYAYPKIVMVNKNNGKLIIHNPLIDYARTCTLELLSDESIIYPHNQIRALTDCRMNRYANRKLSKTTKIIRETISIEMEENLNLELLRIVLEEKFMKEAGSELGKRMQQFKKDELLSLHGCLLEYKALGKTSFEPLRTLLDEGNQISEIENAYEKEVANRFFSGDIV